MPFVGSAFGNFGGVESDPHWDSVILLIQDGTSASATMIDRSSYGDTADITTNAAFTDTYTVFGNNVILTAANVPQVEPFTSSGAASRFTRADNEDFTVESYVYWKSGELVNATTSASLWQWRYPSNGLFSSVSLYVNTGNLQWQIGETAIQYDVVSSDTLHFIQLTIVGNTAYLDLDGVQVASRTVPASSAGGDYTMYVSGAATGTDQGGVGYYNTPLRMTKGVARARGSVPTAEFPIP